ncbi:MAG: Gfo/Idh/MocA family oxidoreductase [Saprospiraceae bacterium]
MSINRRKFLSAGILAGASTVVSNKVKADSPSLLSLNKSPNGKLGIGVLGVGGRGRSHVEQLLFRDDCEVVAINDIDPVSIDACKKQFTDASKPMPQIYISGDYGYLDLLQNKAVDAIIIATPWEWHSEMAIAGMKAGKYTATEVCGAFSLDECWELVNTHEATGNHLFFMENVCYRRDVMAILNMVRQNLFGELIHLEGGYQHDLRDVKFNDGKQFYGGGVEFNENGFHEARWRTRHSVYRNGDLYPTHGLGPIAMMNNINRGNRLSHLTSMATKSRGLHNYIINHPKGGPSHPNASVDFKLGDIVTTMIKCANGETITLFHDTNSPRPYSLGFRVQGTDGIWMDVNQSLMLQGKTKAHTWEPADEWLKKYDHPLWKKYESKAEGAGHGGMDWFVIHSFIEGAKRGLPAAMDAYDAATWLSITALSEESIALGSHPVAIPDFTRGKWIKRKNEFVIGDDY